MGATAAADWPIEAVAAVATRSCRRERWRSRLLLPQQVTLQRFPVWSPLVGRSDGDDERSSFAADTGRTRGRERARPLAWVSRKRGRLITASVAEPRHHAFTLAVRACLFLCGVLVFQHPSALVSSPPLLTLPGTRIASRPLVPPSLSFLRPRTSNAGKSASAASSRTASERVQRREERELQDRSCPGTA